MAHDVVDRPADSAPPPRRGRKALRFLGLLGLLLLPVLGAAAGYAVALATPERYTADAYVLIGTGDSGGAVTPGDIAQAVARVATNESVLAAGGDDSLVEAARNDDLSATASPDAPLVELSATASTAEESADLANALAEAVEQHMSTSAEVDDVRVSTFATASPPADPSTPNVLVNVLAGAALGLLLATIGFVLRRT